MSRPPSVWFREQAGWYMSTIGVPGTSPGKAGADAKKTFYKLTTRDTPAPQQTVDGE